MSVPGTQLRPYAPQVPTDPSVRKLAARNSEATVSGSAVVPSSRPAPSAAPSTAAWSLSCPRRGMDASMANPTSGISRKGEIRHMRTITEPLWRERREEEGRILFPCLTRLEDAVGIHSSAKGKGFHGESLRPGFGDIQDLAGRQGVQRAAIGDTDKQVADGGKGGHVSRVIRLAHRVRG